MDSKAYQKGIHYSRHCKGIHRNLKAFQREFTIIGIPREFIWIPRHSRGILLRIRMESVRIPRHSKRVFTTVRIVREFIEISTHSKGHFASYGNSRRREREGRAMSGQCVPKWPFRVDESVILYENGRFVQTRARGTGNVREYGCFA